MGAVGRLHPGKRFDLLLDALAPTLGPDRHLLIVGEGEERESLAALARDRGVAPWVHLPGERPVADQLSAMDVLASPSRYETFGLAVLEALANGLPVVYRRCPALDELGTPVPGAFEATDDELRPRVDEILDRPAQPRVLPEALRRLDVRTVAARVDDVYDGRSGRRRRGR